MLKRKRDDGDDVVMTDALSYSSGSTRENQPLVYIDTNDHVVAPGTQWAKNVLADIGSPIPKTRTEALLQMARTMSLCTDMERSAAVDTLCSRLVSEEDNEIKALIVRLIGRFCRHPNVNASQMVKLLSDELSSRSIKIRYQLYSVFCDILQSRQVIVDVESASIILSLSDRAIAELVDPHHRVRATCLQLLATLPFVLESVDPILKSMSQAVPISRLEAQKVISGYVLDNDPRVRKSALTALVQMHLRGCPLDIALYALAVNSTRDDHEQVRLGGLHLLWALSSLYPNHPMNLAHEHVQETVPLINDAFVRICDLVNDSSVVIRTKACVIMASFQHVTTDVLSQTFSKQIMSRLKRRIIFNKEENQQRVIPVAEGDFDVESDEFRLLDSGACGAFVHGLEDEYQEVRNASVDSICEICMHNEQLVKQASACLVDMFNDEIDKVRLNAIQSLRKIGTRTTLEFGSEELEITLGVLDDSDRNMREAAHDLIRVVRLSVKDSMNALLDALVGNMKRYPEDKLSIYRCLCDVGKHHEDYVAELVPSLLKLDKRFLAKEANVEDYFYTANVILIINACTSNTTILRTLPSYMFRHFAYFKSKYPDCMPDLKKLYKNANITLQGDADYLPVTFSAEAEKLFAADMRHYVESMSDMLNTIRGHMKRSDLDVALLTLEAAVRNIEYIADVKPSFAGKVDMAVLYLQCYQQVIKIKQSHSSPAYAASILTAASTLFRLSYTIQYSFLGLSSSMLHATMYFRVLGNMIWMFGVLKQTPSIRASPLHIKNMLTAFITRLDLMEKQFQKEGYQCKPMAKLKSQLEAARASPSTSHVSTLYQFITTFLPLEIKDLNNLVKHTSASISYPLPNPDKPYKYPATSPVRLTIEADITNATSVNNIAVEVIHPDQSTELIWPMCHQFKPITPLCYKLNTTVDLNLSDWREANSISIRIVRSFEPDLVVLDRYIMEYPNRPGSHSMMDTWMLKSTSTVVISDELVYELCPV